MTTARAFILLAATAIAPLVYAQQTFIWNSDDARFAASFSITDTAFLNRHFEFTDVTAHSFSFNDPAQIGDVWHITSNSPSALMTMNFDGNISLDGMSLLHNALPNNPNVSFWLASWYNPISVGIYSYNTTGTNDEVLKYVNYTDQVFVSTAGTWSHVGEPQVVATPDSGPGLAMFAAVLGAIFCASAVHRRKLVGAR